MVWLTAVVKAVLEWLTSLAKQDVKAGDADDIPKSLKDRWRRRIQDQLDKQKKKDEKSTEKSDDS